MTDNRGQKLEGLKVGKLGGWEGEKVRKSEVKWHMAKCMAQRAESAGQRA